MNPVEKKKENFFSLSCINKIQMQNVFAVQILLLFFASNNGYIQQVQGRTLRFSHDLSIQHQNQYTSFENLQKSAENPFENNTFTNITVPLGETAFLRCKVRNLGERSVSWIRRRDFHILTTGKTTYTNDERFNVLHSDGSEDWTLQIKYIQTRDQGSYECQVSTGLGVVSFFVHLSVTVPEAFILGNGEYHVERGSTINLVCIIEKSPNPPPFVFWFHNGRLINFESSREVKVSNEPGSKTHSRLQIHDATINDGGNYTCKTANADPASITVFVSEASGYFSGNKLTAFQKKNEERISNFTNLLKFTISPTNLFIFYAIIIIINYFNLVILL